MPDWIYTLLNLLSQFTGGRGGVDHVIVDFTIAAVCWSILLWIAIAQNRTKPDPRDALLRWGFAAALARELLMLSFALIAALGLVHKDVLHIFFPPLEHALSGAAQVVVGAAFMRFLVPGSAMPARYLRVGVAIHALSYLATFWWWGSFIIAHPERHFGQTWCDWLFHITASGTDAFAAIWLARNARGQIRNTVCVAFAFLFLWDFLKLPDMALGERYENIFHPIFHLCHLIAIPLFGLVYVRELIARRTMAEQVAAELSTGLEARVAARTLELEVSGAAEQARSRQAFRLQRVLFALAKDDKSNLEVSLQNLLGATGQALGVERVSFWTATPALDTLICRTLYTLSSDSVVTTPFTLCEADHPAYFQALRKMTQIVADDARAHESTRDFTEGYFIPLGITSMLDVPLWLTGRVAGVLCCEHVGPARAWTQAEMDFSNSIVEMLALAVESAERQRMESELRSAQSRQATLVELEAAINREETLQKVLDDIAETVTSQMPASAASVVLWDAVDETFTVSATTVPGQPSQAGAQRVRRSGGASRAIVDSGAPVITPDVSEDPHSANALLDQFGMRAYAGVPLLSDGKVLGVLYAIDREVRKYTAEDVGFLTAVASRATAAMVRFRLYESLRETNAQLADEVAERRVAEKKISASLREKEVMLQEIHHRVKNNLQVVSSLLNLQSRDNADPGLRAAFAESQQRIRSMALIHEMLYQSENLAEIDFGNYLRALVPVLLRSYNMKDGQVTHHIEADVIALRPQTAVPMGLIVNELVTNSLKHGFRDGRGGRISILCRRRGHEVELTVSDDGVGLPPDFTTEKTTSLGLRLVGMMKSQLDGRFEARNDNGAKFVFTFILAEVETHTATR